MTDAEDLDLEDKSTFEILLMGSQQPGVFEEATFLYQRCPEPSLRTVQRKWEAAKELQNAAQGSKKICSYFQIPGPMPEIVQDDQMPGSLLINGAVSNDSMRWRTLTKKLRKKAILKSMNRENLVRHQAVLSFLCMQEGKQLGEAGDSMSRTVARCFGKGTYFARRLITWEIEWVTSRSISEGRRGCFVKVKSWPRD